MFLSSTAARRAYVSLVIIAVVMMASNAFCEEKSQTEESQTLSRDFTVEGENQIQIDFERPTLHFEPDPQNIPDMDPESPLAVIDRTPVDPVPALLERLAFQRTPYLARPWLHEFASGTVAAFHPALEGVDRWRLAIADSRGETVVTFDGKGDMPDQIGWDGRSQSGSPAPPGLTYSYMLEAYDRAGNKRNFVGEGFQLPPYRLETSDSLFLLLPGSRLSGEKSNAIMMEAASWLNQEKPSQPIQVRATARTFDQAKSLAESVSRSLKPLLLGDPLRVLPVTEVVPGAPERGTVTIVGTR